MYLQIPSCTLRKKRAAYINNNRPNVSVKDNTQNLYFIIVTTLYTRTIYNARRYQTAIERIKLGYNLRALLNDDDGEDTAR